MKKYWIKIIPMYAMSYNNLSTVYQDMGDLNKALEYQVKAIEIKEKVLDKNHINRNLI